MTDAPVAFKRLIVGLESGASDPAMLRFAAEFAGLLQIDLFGLFACDPRLEGLADLPVLREFRTLERRWLATPGADLARSLELAAALARRALDEAGKSAGVICHFELTRATAAEAITAVSGATDIVIAAQTKAPHGRARQPFPDLVAAALATPAAVLIVPDPLVRRRGPVLVIAEMELAPDVAASATAIATAADERLEVIAPSSLRLPPPWGLPDLIGERLIVMSREGGGALEIASHRRVPVLVMPPTDVGRRER